LKELQLRNDPTIHSTFGLNKTRKAIYSMCLRTARLDVLRLKVRGLRAALVFVTLFSAGCASTKMASNSTPPPAGTSQLAVSPASMNFPNVAVGSSQNQNGTLTANSSSVTVSTASWNGTGFSLSGITFPVTIPAGQSIPFTVTFAPQTAGATSGAVYFLSTATNSPTNETLAGTGVQASQHTVGLSWNADISTVQGYYVYRGGQTGGPYARISALQPATSYTDASVVSGQTYYYVVTALGTNSLESAYSNQAVATIP
jgi:hypothetical protein